jgi:hypothetical protein
VSSSYVHRTKQNKVTTYSISSVVAKISAIVAACKKVLFEVQQQYYTVKNDASEYVDMIDNGFYYKDKILNTREYDFYQANSTPLGVLKYLDNFVRKEAEIQYELFPVNELSENCKRGVN